MKIKIRKFSKNVRTQKKYILLMLLLELQLFSIVNIPMLEDYNTITNKMLMVIITILFVGFYYGIERYNMLGKKYFSALNVEFFILLGILIVQACYTMPKYNETLVDIVRATGHLLLILIAYALIDIYIKEDKIEKILDLVVTIVFVSVLLTFLNSIYVNITGGSLLNISTDIIRNGRHRLNTPTLNGFMIIYSFYRIIMSNMENKKMFIGYFIVGMITLFYTDMTRMMEISIIVSILAMILIKKNLNKKQMLLFILLICMLLIISQTSFFSGVLESFSISGEQGGSTSARLNAMLYFKQFTDKNFWLGMGMVRPYRPDLYYTYFGPVGSYNCLDDIGIFGLFYYYGFLGLLIYILFLIRIVYIIIRLFNDKKDSYFTLILGLYIFVLSTSTSLIITNAQRAMYIPIIVSISEFAWFKVRIRRKKKIQ